MEKSTEENNVSTLNAKNEKKGKSKLIKIIVLLLVIALVAAIALFIVNKEDNNDVANSEDTKIGNTYYETLKKYETDEMYKETNEWNFKVYNMKDVEYPVLVADCTDTDYINRCTIYYIKNDKVVEKVYSPESEVKCLFNTDKEEYGYYLVENDGTTITYTLLNDLVNEVENPFKISILIKDNEGSYDSKSGLTVKIMPTEEHFIKVGVVIGRSLIVSKEEKDLKKELESMIKNTKYLEDYLDSDIKRDVQEKLTKIRKQQEEVKEYKEKHSTSSSSNTSSNSSLTNTDTNSTSSSNGTTNQTTDIIQVGQYTIKVGTYKGKAQGMDGSYYDVILKINKNNLTIDGQTLSYSIRDNYIVANGFEMFQVNGNNSIQQLAGDMPTLKYQN